MKQPFARIFRVIRPAPVDPKRREMGCREQPNGHEERIAAQRARVEREEPPSQRVASLLNARGGAGRRRDARAYLLAHGSASAKVLAGAIRSHQRTIANTLAHPWFTRGEDGLWTLTPAGLAGKEELCS